MTRCKTSECPLIGGKNAKFGALARFLELVEAGQVPRGSWLLVESLDRISRDKIRLALPIFLNVVNAGIKVATLLDNRVYDEESIDNNPMELFGSLLVLQRANEESETKSRRLRETWEKNRREAREGTRKLTRKCPAWLRLSPDRNSFIVNEELAAIVRMIFEWAAAGMGQYAIAQRLNLSKAPPFSKRGQGWHSGYVSKLLSSKLALGEYQPSRYLNGRQTKSGEPIPDYYPAIIEKALWLRAQEARRCNHTQAGAKRVFEKAIPMGSFA